jgi:hypothetical protein
MRFKVYDEAKHKLHFGEGSDGRVFGEGEGRRGSKERGRILTLGWISNGRSGG